MRNATTSLLAQSDRPTSSPSSAKAVSASLRDFLALSEACRFVQLSSSPEANVS